MKNGHSTRQKAPAGRYALLDELRGLDLVSMMLYHACWDLVFLFDVNMRWYAGTPGRLWQQSICWVFILLSGFCVQLGHHTLRRGAQVFGAGALVTAVTLLFMPEDRVIFGVLTLLGSAMLLTDLLEKPLRRIPPAAGFAISAVLFALTRNVSAGYLGFGSLRLWLPQALYANCVTAYFLYGIVGRQRMEPLRRSVCPALGWMGRHSLLLYLLHQPVIYGVLSAAALFS